MMFHTAESIAIAQARRQSVADLHDELYARLESDSVVVDGTIWEARIDWTDGYTGTSGYILAAKSFGTLLSSLHVRGFLTGEHGDDERLASVRRVAA